MYNEGDQVRIVPKSYIDISETFFNYPECWAESDPEVDTNLMLGGLYNILSISSEEGRKWYSLLANGENNMGRVSEALLMPASNFTPCPFEPGDKVVFSPQFDNRDQKFLVSVLNHVYGFMDFSREHIIKEVLNNYFIFVDYDKNSEYAYPFRWIDFSGKEADTAKTKG